MHTFGIKIDPTQRTGYSQTEWSQEFGSTAIGHLTTKDFWSTELIIRFSIIKGIPKDHYCTESFFELSSNHFLVNNNYNK